MGKITSITLALIIFTTVSVTSSTVSADWEAEIVFNKRIDRQILPVNFYGSVIIDEYDNLYFSWFESANDVLNLIFVKSDDGGNSFSTPIVVVNGSYQAKGPTMVVEGDEIHLAWNHICYPQGNIIYLASSLDGGVTFEVKEIITSNLTLRVADPVLEFVDSRLYIAWSDNRSDTGWHSYLAYSDDNGKTFSNPIGINDDYVEGDEQHSWVHITSGSNECLYILWSDTKSGSNIVYMAKTVDGKNITERVRVSQHYGRGQEIKQLPDGKLVAMWRETIANEGEIMYAVSSDGGDSWSEDRIFTHGNVGGFDHVHFAMDVDNNGHMYGALIGAQYEEQMMDPPMDIFLSMLESPSEGISEPRGEVLPTYLKINPGDWKENESAYMLSSFKPSIDINSKNEIYILYFMNIPDPDSETGWETGMYLAKIIFNPAPDSNEDIFGVPPSTMSVFVILSLVIIGILLLFLSKRRKDNQPQNEIENK